MILRFAPELKEEAARQIIDRAHPISDVSERLVCQHTAYINGLRPFGRTKAKNKRH